MNYETDYHFCFPNESLWGELRDAQKARDGHAISQIVEAQVEEIGPEVRRDSAGEASIITDPDIFLNSSPDLALMNKHKPDPTGLGTYEEELELVWQASQVRDMPLSEVPESFPETMRNVSWFLRDYLVDEYAAGESFGHTAEEHERLYSGKAPNRQLTKTGQKKNIETGRDFCSLVHSDNPMVVASMVIGDLERSGVEKRNCPAMEDSPGLTRFASVGPPYILGGCGTVLLRCGILGFIEKQTVWKARPVQDLAAQGRYLMSAYPELHPNHQSQGAMHAGYIAAIVGFLGYVYSRQAMLPHGQSVGYELDLLRGNISDGRVWPGVHTRYDNQQYWARFEALGIKVAKEYLR